jgi:hypothetical protein
MSLEKRTPLEELNGHPEFSPTLSLQGRVKLYCSWCCGDTPAVECPVKCCELWAYRTGRGPKRAKRPRTEAQLANDRRMSEKPLVLYKNGTAKAKLVPQSVPRRARLKTSEVA